MSDPLASENLICIEHLSKIFHTADSEVAALRDVNLTIRRGEIFGIIGLSGAGKSTLVRCINFLENPTEGRVLVNGKDLTAMSKKELLRQRQQIGMIFQGVNLLSQRDAIGNVCYPLEITGVPRAKARKRAVELLTLVGLQDRMHAYPSQLSGGQAQRVAIARALANEPQMLLCDEATSALDPTTTRSILDLLQRINRDMGVTIVVITHEMKVVEQICHRVAVIDQSRIVELGNVKDVFLYPQSAIARELILPKGDAVPSELGRRCLRVEYDGATDETLISRLSLQCRVQVGILSASAPTADGTAGSLLIRLPADPRACERITTYLTENGIRFREEDLP